MRVLDALSKLWGWSVTVIGGKGQLADNTTNVPVKPEDKYQPPPPSRDDSNRPDLSEPDAIYRALNRAERITLVRQRQLISESFFTACGKEIQFLFDQVCHVLI